MENISHPLPSHERYERPKRKFILKLEMAHTILLRTARKYRIEAGTVDSCGKTGFKDFDAQVVIILNASEG